MMFERCCSRPQTGFFVAFKRSHEIDTRAVDQVVNFWA